MNTTTIIIIAVLAVLIGLLIFLYFQGQKLQKQQAEAQENLASHSQRISMLVIDKKRMPIKDGGLPPAVMDNIPKRYRRSKVPIVKAKVGPRIMTLVADAKVFEIRPVKKEVKAVVSGIYIMDVRGIRGTLEQPKKKQNFFQRMKAKVMPSTRNAGR